MTTNREIEKRWSSYLECPCWGCRENNNPNKPQDVGCPLCSNWHDEGYLFSNKEVKELITNAKKEAVQEYLKSIDATDMTPQELSQRYRALGMEDAAKLVDKLSKETGND